MWNAFKNDIVVFSILISSHPFLEKGKQLFLYFEYGFDKEMA